jgi:hypothetical protein
MSSSTHLMALVKEAAEKEREAKADAAGNETPGGASSGAPVSAGGARSRCAAHAAEARASAGVGYQDDADFPLGRDHRAQGKLLAHEQARCDARVCLTG